MSQLELAVNSALHHRREYLARLGMGGIDNKRAKAWQEYGYKNDLCFDDYLKLYDRGGVAHGAVHRLTEKCWETNPWVIQGVEYDDKRPETPWEKSLRMLFKQVKMWHQFADSDRRRLVGHYSGLLLQIADNRRWDQPAVPKVGTLVRVIPAWEGQLQPTQWDEDPLSPTYGEPSMWDYQEAQVKQNDTSAPGRAVTVHPSRVVILGDIRDGVPFLRAGYNDCVNLEKILGGSGESFLKNAARQIAVEFDKDVDLGKLAADAGVNESELQALFNKRARELNLGNDVLLALQGGKASPLVATVPDPQEHFDIALASFAASVRMPVKVLVGMQTGERASTEDLRDFNKRGQGRRVNELSNDIELLVNHLIRLRLVEAPPGGEFSVMWDDLTESSAAEKMELAVKMADVNQKQQATGDQTFTNEEIRDTAGFDNTEALEPLPDVEPEPDVMPEPGEGSPA